MYWYRAISYQSRQLIACTVKVEVPGYVSERQKMKNEMHGTEIGEDYSETSDTSDDVAKTSAAAGAIVAAGMTRKAPTPVPSDATRQCQDDVRNANIAGTIQRPTVKIARKNADATTAGAAATVGGIADGASTAAATAARAGAITKARASTTTTTTTTAKLPVDMAEEGNPAAESAGSETTRAEVSKASARTNAVTPPAGSVTATTTTTNNDKGGRGGGVVTPPAIDGKKDQLTATATTNNDAMQSKKRAAKKKKKRKARLEEARVAKEKARLEDEEARQEKARVAKKISARRIYVRDTCCSRQITNLLVASILTRKFLVS